MGDRPESGTTSIYFDIRIGVVIRDYRGNCQTNQKSKNRKIQKNPKFSKTFFENI
jgi:hypothetical protein